MRNRKGVDWNGPILLLRLHNFKTTPGLYTNHFVSSLLPARKDGIEERAAQAIARILHIDVTESFTSRINREHQDAGTNDIAEVAAQMPPDSAANVLRKFRRDEL